MARTASIPAHDAPLAPYPAGLLARARAFVIGAGMTAAGGFLLASALTHHPLDPSLNAATSGPVRNIAGEPGAVTADLLLQTLGWAGAGLALALV
jgi:DNA segregation ATPase FtsK/SpoIIIE, S-DNA-T family